MTEADFFGKYINEKRKSITLHSYKPEIVNQMGVGIMVMAFSEHSLIDTHTADFYKILSLLKSSRDKGEISKELLRIIDKNFANTIELYKKYKKETFNSILGDKLKNYTYLFLQSDKKEVAEKIKVSCFADKKNKSLVERYDVIEKSLRMFDPRMLNLSVDALKVKIDDDPDEILLGLASIIEEPSRLAYQREALDPDYNQFPLKWYSLFMSIVDFRRYYKRFKAGESIDDYVEKYVDSRLDYIRVRMDDHYFSPLAERAIVLNSVIDAYSVMNYPSAICACLPLLEGTILKFADYYHFHLGGLFCIKDGRKCLQLKNGTLHKEFTIGDLLKNSELSELFDQAFIAYFCDDLYSERNPILHGIDVSGFNKINTAKKILTVDYIMDVVDDFIFKQYQKDIDEVMDEATYTKLTSGINLDEIDLSKLREKSEEIKKRKFNLCFSL